jgi:hypothetical protein
LLRKFHNVPRKGYIDSALLYVVETGVASGYVLKGN